jgi:UDP-N-acetylmuramoyl-L-alanyl-D-glutamate--2,6-diaminopimelate ligase
MSGSAARSKTLAALIEEVRRESSTDARRAIRRIIVDGREATTSDLAGVTITDVDSDSRRATTGTLYCCVVGDTHDGHDHAAAAVRAGAAAVLVERELTDLPAAIPQIVVDDSRRATGPFAAAFHDEPSRHMRVVGVTGTNGKTTTAHVLADVLRAAGLDTRVIGTLTGVRTTPDAPELQRLLAAHRADGAEAVVMEVSSHALAQHRVAGMRFAAAVFTNLGHDHLDFHGTLERYFAAKASLFDPRLADMGVVNRDDVHGRLLIDGAALPIVSFGLEDARDVEAGVADHRYTWQSVRVNVGLGGHFNVMNSLAAATTALALGTPVDDIVRGLAAVTPVPGRFEYVDVGRDFAVIVDYAHTPEALARVLESARRVARSGRVIVVFGCGGGRDASKRPDMGAVATRDADAVVLTSDNPRNENPAAIIADIERGVPAQRRDVLVAVEEDRRAGIARALSEARSGDVVVVAGKGHEATQTIADREIPFRDVDVVRELAGMAA